MMVDNITNLTTAETLYDFVKFGNEVTNGIVGLMLLISIIIILTAILSKRLDLDEALLVSSFVGFVISMGLTALNLIDPALIILTLLIVVFDGFWIYIKNSG